MPGIAKLTPEIIAAAVKWRRAGVPIAQIAKRIATQYCVHVTPQAVHQALAKLRIETKLAGAKRVRASVSTGASASSSAATAASASDAGGSARELVKLQRDVRRVRKQGSASVQLRAAAEERAIILARSKIEGDSSGAKTEQFSGLADMLGRAAEEDAEQLRDRPAQWLADVAGRLAEMVSNAASALERVPDRAAVAPAIAALAPYIARMASALEKTTTT
jgi:hypothetical protein